MSDSHKVINAVRQYDPATVRTRLGFYRTLRRKWLMRDMRCLPAVVIDYDPSVGFGNVQPLPQKVYKNVEGKEEYVNRSTYSVHFLQFNHGSYKVSAPIRAGDTGYLFACDRKCDKAISKNAEPILKALEKDEIEKDRLAPSDDGTICDFENGFFIPCSWADSISDFDENGNATDKDEQDALVVKSIENADENGEPDTVPLKVILHKTGDIGNEAIIKLDDVLKAKFSAEGITIEAEVYDTVEIVTNLRYDIASYQLQKKTRTFKKIGNILYDPSEESEWTMVDGGQAVPEQSSN